MPWRHCTLPAQHLLDGAAQPLQGEAGGRVLLYERELAEEVEEGKSEIPACFENCGGRTSEGIQVQDLPLGDVGMTRKMSPDMDRWMRQSREVLRFWYLYPYGTYYDTSSRAKVLTYL